MRESIRIWQHFVSLPGASVDGMVGIASEQAIHGLIKVMKRKKPNKILELGAGIGTLTYTILRTISALGIPEEKDFNFCTVENNKFCLEQLANNLNEFKGSYQVIHSPEEISGKGFQFDLIVVDGGGDVPGDMGIMNFSNMLKQGGAIFVEGSRVFQRQLITRWYGDRPHIYVKMEAHNRVLISRHDGRPTENKPYHLFVFEPKLHDTLQIKTVGFWNYGYVRLKRRLKNE